MVLDINKISINKFNWAKGIFLALIFTLQFKLVSSQELEIENNTDEDYILYKKPITYDKDGIQVSIIFNNSARKVFKTDTGNLWYRIKTQKQRSYKEFMIGNYSKKVIINSIDSVVVISDTTLNYTSKNDSIIYLTNEQYYHNEFDMNIKDAKQRSDTIDAYVKFGKYLAPKKINMFIALSRSLKLHRELIFEKTIDLKVRSYIASCLIVRYMALSNDNTESFVHDLFEEIIVKEKELFNLICQNKDIKYLFDNIKFYDRITNLIEEKNIRINKGKKNIFYFTGSWCGPCMLDLKKMSDYNYNLEKVNLIIVPMEDDETGVVKIKKLLSQTNLKYNLLILNGGRDSEENKKLGVYAVPQIYLYDTRETSKQIRIKLSEYLKTIEGS